MLVSTILLWIVLCCLISRTEETPVSTIESAFQEFTERKDIAILLINQHVSVTPVMIARVPIMGLVHALRVLGC
jgi:hypothetical protein